MRHWVVLGVVYALVAALVLPGSLFAAGEPAVPAADPAASGADPAAPPPLTHPEPPPAAVAPAPALTPGPPEPARAAVPALPAAQPAPTTPPPPQALPDEQPVEAPVAKAAASASVTIKGYAFAPASVTVSVGDTVTWSNADPVGHSATASGSFDTGVFPEGESRSQTFDQAGTFAYICTPHPKMKGTVVVQAASDGGGDTGSGSTGSGDAGSGATGSDSTADGTAGDVAAGTASGAESGASLPTTGMDAAALALLGLLMLCLGAAMRRRSRDEQPRPAGRVGW